MGVAQEVINPSPKKRQSFHVTCKIFWKWEIILRCHSSSNFHVKIIQIFYFFHFRHFSWWRKLILEVQNLSFSFINQMCIQLCYHKKGIKLVNGFYWSVHISLKNNKTNILVHLFEKLHLQSFSIQCDKFQMHKLHNGSSSTSLCLWYKHFYKCHIYL